MASVIYTQFKEDLLAKALNLAAAGDTCKAALFTSTYTPAAADTTYGSGNLASNEVSNSGTGYTTGGKTLTAANNSILTAGAPVIGWTNTTDGATSTPGIQYTSATFTCRYVVIYDSTVSSHAIACIDLGGDKVVTAGTFTVNWHADGIITFT